MEPGSGYLAECSLVPIQAAAARSRHPPPQCRGPRIRTTTCGSGPATVERKACSGAAGRQWGPAALRDTAARWQEVLDVMCVVALGGDP